jgi:uncharacterized protein YnzC (UPF0291/DUF896 family)
MAKPQLHKTVSSQVVSGITELEKRNASLLQQLNDYVEKHGTVEQLRQIHADLKKKIDVDAEVFNKLERDKAALEAWVVKFQNTERQKIESEFRTIRSTLQQEVTELRKQKAVEEESMRTLLTAQEINTKQAMRESQSLAKQVAYLHEHRDFCRKETERLNTLAAGMKETRLTLNERSLKLDYREKDLQKKEELLKNTFDEAEKIRREGLAASNTARSQAVAMSEDVQSISSQRAALSQEKHAMTNKLTEVEAGVAKAKAEYEAIRANQTALERRERLVEAKERALKRKGITLELD